MIFKGTCKTNICESLESDLDVFIVLVLYSVTFYQASHRLNHYKVNSSFIYVYNIVTRYKNLIRNLVPSIKDWNYQSSYHSVQWNPRQIFYTIEVRVRVNENSFGRNCVKRNSNRVRVRTKFHGITKLTTRTAELQTLRTWQINVKKKKKISRECKKISPRGKRIAV